MIAWWRRRRAAREAAKSPKSPGDMRSSPVDNPLDFRADGSIREGDPAWAAMMEMMGDGLPRIGTQNPDGTWTVEKVERD